MAESLELVQEKLDDRVTECSVCMEVFIKPKLLPCYHTFCLICIEKLGDGKQVGDQCCCPLCRKEFDVPSGGFNFLPDNVFIQRLLGISGSQSKVCSAAQSTLCSICNDDEGGTQLAEFTCVTCLENMCTDCSSHHRKMKLTRSHEVVPITEESRFVLSDMQTAVGKSQMSFCKIHSGVNICRFCFECDIPLCWKCPSAEHKGHKFADLADVAESIESYTKMASDRVEEAKKLAMQLEIEQKKFFDDCAEIEKKVLLEAEKIKRFVDGQASLLINELQGTKQKKVKEFECRKEELKFNTCAVESLIRFGRLLVTQSTCLEIFRLSKSMEERKKEVNEISLTVTYSFDPVDFRSSFAVDYLTAMGKNAVGQIVVAIVNTGDESVPSVQHVTKLQSSICQVTEPQKLVASSSLAPTKSAAVETKVVKEYVQYTVCSQIDTIHVGGNVVALTGIEDELFVLTEKDAVSIRLNVYDQNTLKKKSHYMLRVLRGKTPKDMVADVNKNLLYINCTDGHLYVLTPDGCVKDTWNIDRGSDGLFVTTTGSILVTYCSSVKEYSWTGYEMQEIDLDTLYRSRSDFEANHTISRFLDQFIICHGGIGEDSRLHGLFEINHLGRRLDVYRPDDVDERLTAPRRMIADSRNGILVLDQQNDKVRLLNYSDFEFVRDIVDLKEIYDMDDPDSTSMWLDEKRGNLFVGFESGDVLVACVMQ